MSLVAWVKGRRGASGFGYASTAEEVTADLDLTGQTVLVTGVASGLGRESARVLARRGACVVGAARSEAKAAEACRAWPGAVPLACDLAEPASVRAAVARVRALGLTLDVVLCNAGVMMPPTRTLAHGQELQFLTNHVGHFMLVTGLLDRLRPAARVVVVASSAHRWAPPEGIALTDPTLAERYTPRAGYGQSKLANVLFARALARRFAGTARTANALHPGVIKTDLGRHMSLAVRALMPLARALAMKSIPQGAATQCWAATHPSLATTSGAYFADCNLAEPSAHARDDALGERLWDLTEAIVARFHTT